jgi:hypothetical protein
VPDHYVGKEVLCPSCHKALVPLTPDKMESYAAKVLFSAPAQRAPAPTQEVVREEATGPEIPFACPLCGETYQVSEELVGKRITCRNCRELCKVNAPAPKQKRSSQPSRLPWLALCLGMLLAALFVAIGFIMGRISR